ncbi:MAG: heavy metal translocating P-type ATPase [Gammaproteobacteria bacterium]|nr:heavy metal translocating P-type ATPase [Gammaproteobacteria bacterium]
MLDKVKHCFCYHCRALMPTATALTLEVDGHTRLLCCSGCMAAVQFINALDLQSYYDFRDKCAPVAGLTAHAAGAGQTLPELAFADAIEELADGRRALRLLIPDLRCAACVWLLEQVLGRQRGIEQVQVSFASRRLRVEFNPAEGMSVPAIAQLVQRLGYQPEPDLPDAGRQSFASHQRNMLIRLGVAGIGMMPVMMFALPAYLAGGTAEVISGSSAAAMDPLSAALLRWASLALSSPVVLYSAFPFHRGAWYALRHRSLSTDLPVSIAILAAFLLSVVNTLNQVSEVYFDTACMFTFFLLLGRYAELQSRRHFQESQDLMSKLLPLTVRRVNSSNEETVPLRDVDVGDLLRVLPGETIPADGVVVNGRSSVSDSAFTGEPLPSVRQPGARVLAGATNHDGELVIRASTQQQDFVLTQINRLFEQASQYRPHWSRLADRAASWFIGAVLVLAAAADIFWELRGADNALIIALTVLVVACPCALSLATPVASTVATTTLRRRGVVIRNGAFLERAAATTAVVFDKTGTLTEAQLHIDRIVPLHTLDTQACLATATALERHSHHPIARAFACDTALTASAVVTVPGQGVEGEIAGVHYRLGLAAYAWPDLGSFGNTLLPPAQDDGLWVLLAAETPLAWFRLQDVLRDDAAQTVDALRKQGITTAIFSGDSSVAGRHLAETLRVDQLRTGLTPEQKIAAVRALNAGTPVGGQRVMMIGDGVNDAGAMAAADTSIAISPRDVLVQNSADATLLNPNLTLVPDVLRFARRTRRIIRQNIGWSLAYNLSVIPVALLGLLPPWLAALGMSLSSLLVVMNAWRLRRMED